MKQKKKFPRFWVGLGVLMLLLLLPWIIWEGKSAKSLSVAVLDKTVTNDSYREHKGLFWILNQQKYRMPGGDKYLYDQDYYGNYPKQNGIRPEERTLAEIPPDTQLLYVADTYGLLEAEEEDEEVTADRVPANAGGSSPRGQNGGMKIADVHVMEAAAARGTMLVAEFNSIATPTTDSVRSRASALLGMEWTGWTARYFPDLTAGVEVPEWVPAQYKETTGQDWAYTGAGFLFVQKDGDLFVLREGSETEGGARISFTQAGQDRFGMKPGSRYNYWFDVVTPVGGSEVLAEYNLQLTSTGQAMLAERGLRDRFPAIIRREASGADTGTFGFSPALGQVSYYFAGDYADHNEYPFWRRYAGWPIFKSWFTFDTPGSEDAFYWDVYVPLMQKVLEEALSVQLSST
ncbi:hypothetical protein [Saccharibacillus kuerlensis]|uniref:DUF3298 domain-containing protein n=1 Tax=Saccharibacillus kuerlensis TaxID=459527 RepID=A0ABQ2L1S9_9BACL|nr:hypothetical protein [Saccharibacillus kuerlensis]GGN99883.1 hypothetical protein GCM10010969_20450 [Saccharibacillus kuerlensis]